MCEKLPGDRCADETCETALVTEATYEKTHPHGPDVHPLERVVAEVGASDETPAERTYLVIPARLEEAERRIERANKRLERAGIEERFTFETKTTFVPIADNRGTVQLRERIELTLNRPSISYGGWTFVASVDVTDAGIITRVAPGHSLDGWRPDEASCDHCNQNRHRTSTYIVRDEAGQIKQIGSGCLRPFLGVSPAGLWALNYEPDIEESYDDPDEVNSHTWREDSAVPLREAIATALAVSNGGENYWSRTRAADFEKTATADAVIWAVTANDVGGRDAQELEEIRNRAQQYLDDGTVDAVIEAGKNIEGTGDYATNLRTVLSGEVVAARHLALAVSSLGTWRRARERALQAEQAAPGYVADVGERIAGTSATVMKVHYMDNPYQYNGVNTLVLFRTESGHVMKWFASGHKSFKVGQKGRFKGGSVKAHDEYRGVDQTVVTRAKFEVLEED